MPENWKALGNAVRASRKARGLSQAALAKLADVHENTVRNIERAAGKYEHRRGTVKQILRALEIPPEHLEEILGRGPDDEVAVQVVDNATLLSRMAALQQRLDQIWVILEQRLGSAVDIIHNSNSDVDVTIEIKHERRSQ